MTQLWTTRRGRLSYQVLQEFYVTVTEKLDPGLDRESARREALGPVSAMLERMWDDALWKLKLVAEFEQTRRGPKPRRRRKKTNERKS